MFYQRSQIIPTPSDPWVEIIEQPRATGMRFRYQCEGRSAGTLLGEHSTTAQKTYPTIKIHNCGPAAVVVVSCVSKDAPYYPHPHSLIGQKCNDAVCTLRVKGTDTVPMMNVGIQCCKRSEVKKAIEQRQKIRVDPFGTGYQTDLDKLDLTTVRLCFQVFLPDANKKFTRVVAPVVSEPVIDKKLVNNLTICRLSKRASCASGGEEVLLLCDKIKKDDIEVQFIEIDGDGELVWQAFGTFSGTDVHHQCAIAFKTPPYRYRDIDGPVTVSLQLRRPSDGSVGEPKEFQYIPNDPGNADFCEAPRKRVAVRNTDQSGTPKSHDPRSNGAGLVPLSVIQNNDDNGESTSSSSLVRSGGVEPEAPYAAAVDVGPIDFSASVRSASEAAAAAVAALEREDQEDVKPSTAETPTTGTTLPMLSNGAILLHQTEDGQLVLPPGFRIILANGQELSGPINPSMVTMAFSHAGFGEGENGGAAEETLPDGGDAGAASEQNGKDHGRPGGELIDATASTYVSL